MRINPCHGCPLREGCEQREEFRQRTRGLGARSVRFRCDKLERALYPGRRIMIGTPRMVGEWEPDLRVQSTAVPATITGFHDDKFTCVIDPGHVRGQIDGDGCEAPPEDKYRFRKYMRAQRIIHFLDEPDMPICEYGRVLRNGVCDFPKGDARTYGCTCKQFAEMAAELSALDGDGG